MRRLIALVAIVSGLVGCNAASSDSPVASVAANGVNITGRIDMGGAGNMSASRITISCAGLSAHPDAQGNYVIQGAIPAGRVAARAAGALDTAYIIVGNDTLREVPVTSWSQVLPTNYVVQRNVSVNYPYADAGASAQVVFWSDADSIAHVVDLGNGTSDGQFSGYIYSVYDDAEYSANAKLYNLAARVKSGTKLQAYSYSVTAVTAKAGDMVYNKEQLWTARLLTTSGPARGDTLYRYTYIKDAGDLKLCRDSLLIRAARLFQEVQALAAGGEWRNGPTDVVSTSATVASVAAGQTLDYHMPLYPGALGYVSLTKTDSGIADTLEVKHYTDSVRVDFTCKIGTIATIKVGLTSDSVQATCTGSEQSAIVRRASKYAAASVRLYSSVEIQDVDLTMYTTRQAIYYRAILLK